ncbi:Protein of unknown function DUF4148 [Burkholderia sp. lig30]|jgi:hypothetical protein|uniref:DUF4148 domain-containing protein n=1 Tax=Burkholderia sp. lig30 TaxID=1192124 RepID=UPI000461516D|nr:DUF4148 domain-containing protein [Burkholderia sp. lig30]KDB08293.1 Protein of unknown function DUF4148 [Burkholderia sp. lig30]
MKSLVFAVVAATALSASFGAFAQSNVSRAQVREELVQLEKAGYQPGAASPYYPEDIQAAEARTQGADTSGYGAQAAPVARAGSPAPVAAVANARDSIFFGH